MFSKRDDTLPGHVNMARYEQGFARSLCLDVPSVAFPPLGSFELLQSGFSGHGIVKPLFEALTLAAADPPPFSNERPSPEERLLDAQVIETVHVLRIVCPIKRDHSVTPVSADCARAAGRCR